MQVKTIISIAVVVLTWIVLAAQTLVQSSQLPPSIQHQVGEHIKKTGKGIILGINARGEDSTALANQLLTEATNNRYYAPLYIATDGRALQKQLQYLGLVKAQLPALIYFNQQGQEIARSLQVNATSSTTPTFKSAMNEGGLEYLSALSDAMSQL